MESNTGLGVAMSQILCWLCPSCGAYVSVGILNCPGCKHPSPSNGRPDLRPAVSRSETVSVRRIAFRIQGREQEPYETVFQRNGSRVTASCSCPAGIKGRLGLCCRHRTRILQGNADGIVSGNSGDVKIVQSWILGSGVETAAQELAEGEAALIEARKRITAAKRALSPVMSK